MVTRDQQYLRRAQNQPAGFSQSKTSSYVEGTIIGDGDNLILGTKPID